MSLALTVLCKPLHTITPMEPSETPASPSFCPCCSVLASFRGWCFLVPTLLEVLDCCYLFARAAIISLPGGQKSSLETSLLQLGSQWRTCATGRIS